MAWDSLLSWGGSGRAGPLVCDYDCGSGGGKVGSAAPKQIWGKKAKVVEQNRKTVVLQSKLSEAVFSLIGWPQNRRAGRKRPLHRPAAAPADCPPAVSSASVTTAPLSSHPHHLVGRFFRANVIKNTRLYLSNYILSRRIPESCARCHTRPGRPGAAGRTAFRTISGFPCSNFRPTLI